METITTKAVVSPKLVLNSYDWKSALRGLRLMVVGTTLVFVGGLLDQYIKNPSIILSIDWKATSLSYVSALGAAIATFGLNLIKKYLESNEYIK